MDNELGRVAEATGLSSSIEPASGLAAPRFDPSRYEWPEIEYDDCYPVDEEFSQFREIPFNFGAAARWLLSELPRASEYMLCFCDIQSGVDFVGKPCKIISFSTGGWSGAESIIALIERRVDLSYFMLSWRRGGHYVFEIPCARLRDSDGSGEAGETGTGSTEGNSADPKGIAQGGSDG